MRILIAAAAGGLLLAACTPTGNTTAGNTAAEVSTDIDGTYKADVASAKLSTKPDVFTVKDGQYDCTSCTPPYKIAADGKPHPVADRDYWDAASLKIVDPNGLEMVRYRKGAAVGNTKITLSADGQSLTWTNTSSDNVEGKSVTNSFKSKRTGPAPAGSHATSGTWVAVNEGTQMADEAITATISVKGDTVIQTFPTGERYEAKFGGPQVPFVGDKAGVMIAVVREGTGFKETDYIGGKAVSEYIYTPVDAKTVTMKVNNLKSGTTEEFTLRKQ
ncbi:MAG: hypothetical protein ABI898_09565 [Sphingomonadales bacterium]